jgi:micrococcal nuclease
MKKQQEQKIKQKENKNKRKSIKSLVALLVILVLALIAVNYSFLDRTLTNFIGGKENVLVERIIDGDTIETDIGNVRFLGINTPERGDFGYQESSDFLETELLNKNVTLEFIGNRYDKYDRLLAYIFLNNENINIKLVELGYANYYFYEGRDKYSDELEDAWEICIENQINLCEPSNNACASCVTIGSDSIINNCTFSCDITDWSIRGEGREKFIYSNNVLNPEEESFFALNLENTGGSLFLRDDEGKLVGWKKG